MIVNIFLRLFLLSQILYYFFTPAIRSIIKFLFIILSLSFEAFIYLWRLKLINLNNHTQDDRSSALLSFFFFQNTFFLLKKL